ncbi:MULTISPECIES: Re/Si-specific NAD(P)(+) transhydrogenase subunit alpha [unclassified Streptomyces]|uniref:Re/Si-specific NAD(P)(+) transhydrogenase subunit alpha n=1 Tax=unclassified Streptomyces TaxID=2593676 RepID=UPI000F6BE181|nr:MULTISPECIES: Re/Si-specific NAD(P)(+) transhydrogenase subunit alpha [unclassified Streptomyces]AZM58301.1 Re/Si-specific NAD(P)(+) transhydrogenase subunit alpha [Streptomyces sp. WAC 01438]RSM88810.1 Re/Si-specific NAD(P)(+) transhydrogenase subunit alpha [Streptomyces sp. WAC 01420]
MSAQHPAHPHPPRRIGVVTESTPGETRVAATPATVRGLRGLGYATVVEPGAGAAAGYGDEAYAQAGADIGDAWDAEVVLKVNAPSTEEIARLRSGATLVALISPAQRPDLLEQLAARGVTVLALDAVPRISRAQSMDVLSSMANIAGYRAVIEAAHVFGRFFTGQVTAAGKVPPAKVLVAGAGVAGLAAIGAASSLGAVVRATDPRPEVADQVKSLGGEYLAVDDTPHEASTDGYARQTSADYDRAAAALYHEQAQDVDIVITTALIPGRPAPRLLTAADVAAMKPGSVVVDMAAAQGGNVEGTIAGRTVVTDNGVTIIGYTDLASRLPDQASQMFGTNVVNLLALITPGKDGRPVLDFDDVVQRAVTVVRSGQVTWPPPPVAVSAAPQDTAPEEPAAAPADPERPRFTPAARYGLIGLGMLATFLLVAYAPAQLAENFTVFALAVVIGFYVIGKVHHALHTPLMSVTNAISGIVVIGALVQIGHGNRLVTVLSFVAILLTSVNVFGGFAVTRRMLSMFSKG